MNSCIQGVLLSTFFISGPAGNSNGLKRRMIGVWTLHVWTTPGPGRVLSHAASTHVLHSIEGSGLSLQYRRIRFLAVAGGGLCDRSDIRRTDGRMDALQGRRRRRGRPVGASDSDHMCPRRRCVACLTVNRVCWPRQDGARDKINEVVGWHHAAGEGRCSIHYLKVSGSSSSHPYVIFTCPFYNNNKKQSIVFINHKNKGVTVQASSSMMTRSIAEKDLFRSVPDIFPTKVKVDLFLSIYIVYTYIKKGSMWAYLFGLELLFRSKRGSIITTRLYSH